METAKHRVPMTRRDRHEVEQWLGQIAAKLDITRGEALHRAVEMMAAWHEIDGLRLSDVERENP